VENATESTGERLTEAAPDAVTETTSSVGESVSNAARNAAESIKSTAESLGASAGFASNSGDNAEGARQRLSRAAEPEMSLTVYVGNLFFDVRGEDLKKEFERAGPVASTKIIVDQRGLSKGFVSLAN
jgi:nucleolin